MNPLRWFRNVIGPHRHGDATRDIERHREATLDEYRIRPLDDLERDIRHGTRSLLRTPLHTLTAVLTLALGIGAATAMFTVINGVLLRPLVYADADRLYLLYESGVAGGQRPPSYPSFQDWERQAGTFDALAFIRGDEFRLRGDDGTQRLLAGYASDGFFRTVRMAPYLGRVFGERMTASDMTEGDVIVLSYDVWRKRFGGDADILGRSVSTADATYTVIGVMPPGFRLPQWADVWIPIRSIPADAAFALTQRDLHVDAEAWGLLASGVGEAAARSDLSRVISGLADAWPEAAAGEWRDASLVPARDRIIGSSAAEQLRIVVAAVALLLLIVCVNVAGLQLARGAGRVREVAVRAALGASRGRLVRQLLTESVLVAVTGGILGAVLAFIAVNAVAARLPTLLPRFDEVGVEAQTLAFAAAITMLTALAAGIVPAVRASAAGLTPAMREGSGGAGSSRGAARLRGSLVTAQVALAVVLTVASGLLLRSLWTLQAADPGFTTYNAVALRVFPPAQYADAQAAATLYRELQDAVRRVPGVTEVALSNHLPLAGGFMATRVETGGPPPAGGQVAIIRTISQEYFHVMGARRVSGRLLNAADFAGAGTGLVINRATAQRFFPDDADPVGRSITIYQSAQGRPDYGEPIQAAVVGIVENEHFLGVDITPPPAVFVPYTWMVWPNISIIARTRVAPERLVPALRRAVQQVDPDIPVAGPGRQAEWRPMSTFAADSLRQRRVMAWLLAGFATSALLLSALGLFGMTAYLVAQQRREIGVRTAIGASRGAIVRMVTGHALRLAIAGVVIGIPAAFGAARVLRSQLFGVTATDPTTVAVATAVFLAAALLAAAVPAVRALRVSPTEALRAE
ncbi:ABC transporter permease [soil metagenome]